MRVLTKQEQKAHLKELLDFCKEHQTVMYNYMILVRGMLDNRMNTYEIKNGLRKHWTWLKKKDHEEVAEFVIAHGRRKE